MSGLHQLSIRTMFMSTIPGSSLFLRNLLAMKKIHYLIHTFFAIIPVHFCCIWLYLQNVSTLCLNNLRVYYAAAFILYLPATAVTYYFLYLHSILLLRYPKLRPRATGKYLKYSHPIYKYKTGLPYFYLHGLNSHQLLPTIPLA